MDESEKKDKLKSFPRKSLYWNAIVVAAAPVSQGDKMPSMTGKKRAEMLQTFAVCHISGSHNVLLSSTSSFVIVSFGLWVKMYTRNFQFPNLNKAWEIKEVLLHQYMVSFYCTAFYFNVKWWEVLFQSKSFENTFHTSECIFNEN